MTTENNQDQAPSDIEARALRQRLNESMPAKIDASLGMWVEFNTHRPQLTGFELQTVWLAQKQLEAFERLATAMERSADALERSVLTAESLLKIRE